MRKQRRLSPADTRIFLSKLSRHNPNKQREIKQHIQHNSDGSITLLDALLIYGLASTIFEDEDYSIDFSDTVEKMETEMEGGGGDFGGGGASGGWEDEKSESSSSRDDDSSSSSSDDSSSSDSGSDSGGDCGGGDD